VNLQNILDCDNCLTIIKWHMKFIWWYIRKISNSFVWNMFYVLCYAVVSRKLFF